jgi:Pseudouridylate synthase
MEIKNYKLEISYVGTNYNGWQRQKNGIGIQQVIEDLLSELLEERITLIGAGRTDAGVHALRQVSNFKTKKHKTQRLYIPILMQNCQETYQF